MEQAFIFGTAAFGNNFTNRDEECKRLEGNFKNGINSIIVSPRRWGKTSLVKKVAKQVNNSGQQIKVVTMDAFMCRTEVDFYRLFTTEIIKQTSNKWEEWMENAKNFLSRVSPKFSMGSDPLNDFSISFDVLNDIQTEQDILDLPQKIAVSKNIRLVVCIDEFQQIAEYTNAINFQKKMRSIWQLQTNVTYCLYGSKMHVLTNLFSKQSSPFYKFGDLIYLQKIDATRWTSYICARFTATGKSISEDLAAKVSSMVDYHSSYVQHLAWLVWVKTTTEATQAQLDEALEDLLNQNKILYYNQTENLTGYQINFLKALVNGVQSEFTRADIIKLYNLGSSANVSRLKKALEQKELIDISGKNVTLLDPLFGYWLKSEF
jgi:hypothetical protein